MVNTCFLFYVKNVGHNFLYANIALETTVINLTFIVQIHPAGVNTATYYCRVPSEKSKEKQYLGHYCM